MLHYLQWVTLTACAVRRFGLALPQRDQGLKWLVGSCEEETEI